MTNRRLKFPSSTTDEEMTAAIAEAGGLAPGSIIEVEVAHDEGCPKLLGLGCRCQPEHRVTIRQAKGIA